MKIALQYVNDSNGKTQSVQLPFTDWEKLMTKLKKYEQTLKIKSDLTEAFEQVAQLKKSKGRKQTLKEFLRLGSCLHEPKLTKTKMVRGDTNQSLETSLRKKI